jgi:hypothetical protein
MGTCSSKSNSFGPSLEDEIASLKEQIQLLMQKDVRQVNEDTIGKSEFFELKGKFDRLEEDVEKKISFKYSQLVSDKELLISDLGKQVESLKHMNLQLEQKLKESVMKPIIKGNTTKVNELSKVKIDEFVEKLLEDQTVNIKYLPDHVEKALYRNVLNLIIGLLNNTFNTMSVKFLGHNLTFNIMPETKSGSIFNEKEIKEVKEVKQETVNEVKKEHIVSSPIYFTDDETLNAMGSTDSYVMSMKKLSE